VFPHATFGQSIVSGAAAGIVQDVSGVPLSGVHVILTEVGTGFTRELETGAAGRFDFLFLSPGEYEVFAERLWFRPVRVRGIAIVPGGAVQIPVTLPAATPPVESAEEVRLQPLVVGLGDGELSRRFSDLELAGLPTLTRGMGELARFSSMSNAATTTEGLPGRFIGFQLDGVPFEAISHPSLPISELPTAAVALSNLAGAKFLTNGLDVEYSGFAGAILSGYTKRGTRRLEVAGFGDWSGDQLASSSHFDPQAGTRYSARGGFLISGPIVRDTSHFVVGLEARHEEFPLPAIWAATDLDATFLAVASDSFGVDLEANTRPRSVTTDLVSTFGRIDGRIGRRNAFVFRGNFAKFETKNAQLGARRIPLLGGDVDGTDASGALVLTSSLTPSIGLELKLGFEFSERFYGSGNVPATVLVDGPIALGVDPALPAQLERLGFRVNETVHFRAGTHRLKFGGAFSVSAHDQTLAPARGGNFVFGGLDEFATRTGSFVQSVGPPPIAQFNLTEYGFFFARRLAPLAGVGDYIGGSAGR